ncbi:MAG: type IVB secretion system protein IcmH/DotU [Tateyamaria sp.]|uniref:type IVB secretion system protein IcmH/DotU n=1 Tax=Tateyamaria sp. TaxID=1929288 RepID=UPI003290DB36
MAGTDSPKDDDSDRTIIGRPVADDGDRTIIGRPMPIQDESDRTVIGRPMPVQDDGDKTIIGRPREAAPARPPPAPPVAPKPAPSALQEDDAERTVFGQKLPEAPVPARPQPVQTPLHQVRAPEPSDESTIIGAKLPEPKPPAPKPLLPSELKRQAKLRKKPPEENKVSLLAATRNSGRAVGKGANPMLAAASDILGLLGRLRTGRVEMHGAPLRDHLRVEIQTFAERCEDAKNDPDDIEDGRYALAATCDDIAATLPGSDPVLWKENALVKTLFDDTNSSAGFFDRYEYLLTNPSKRTQLLELMLACLSLGFEGDYRGASDGPRALTTLRTAGYERLRNTVPRPAADLSKKWTPVVVRGRRLRPLLPLWIVAGVAAGMVVALFTSLAWVLTNEAQATQDNIISLHRPVPPVDIARVQLPEVVEVIVYEAPPTGQSDRIKNQLEDLISQGLTTVQEEGDFIAIRLGDALSFGSGAPTLDSESPLLARIATVLEAEPGGIIVEGHSDNIPLNGRGQFKTNEALSEARAAAVADVLAPYLTEPTRLSVIGVGPSKPLDPANTPEARAKNRRVDILLRKEQQL